MTDIKRIKHIVVNELGNTIEFDFIEDERGITIHAIGPTSEVEHTWTPIEAMTIQKLLNTMLDDDYHLYGL